MLDTQGPEIRTGKFTDDFPKEVQLKAGNSIRLTTDPELKNEQTNQRLWVSYSSLPQTLKKGDRVLIADGEVSR